MSKQKLTPWFVNGEKPVRKGVYQQMCGSGRKLGYQQWTGKHWCDWCETPEMAATYFDPVVTFHQNDPWRGLAHPPKAKP